LCVSDSLSLFIFFFADGYFVGPKLNLPLQEAKLLDASCFLNHTSVNPCLGFLGDYNMVALRHIKAGEMLTYDYCCSEWLAFGAEEFPDSTYVRLKKEQKKKEKKNAKKGKGKQKKKKTKKIEGRKWMRYDDYKRPELQKRYKGHFLSSVQRMIDLFHASSVMGEGGYRELNRAIELREHPVRVIGKGLFAARDMTKGEIVWRFGGIDSKKVFNLV
jgi:hypothetical protein